MNRRKSRPQNDFILCKRAADNFGISIEKITDPIAVENSRLIANKKPDLVEIGLEKGL